MMILYELLGLKPDASPDEISAAHRAGVKKHHPDAGGIRDVFESVHRAGLVLRDPVKRARYDQTGEINDEPENELSTITTLLMSAFDRFMGQMGWEYRDAVESMKRMLNQDIANMNQKKREAEDQLKAYEKARKKLKFTGQGYNPICSVMDQRIGKIKEAIAMGMKGLDQIQQAIDMLDQYGWDIEQRETVIMDDPYAPTFTTFTSRTGA
jgi:curved DNA-binding protein CbpA